MHGDDHRGGTTSALASLCSVPAGDADRVGGYGPAAPRSPCSPFRKPRSVLSRRNSRGSSAPAGSDPARREPPCLTRGGDVQRPALPGANPAPLKRSAAHPPPRVRLEAATDNSVTIPLGIEPLAAAPMLPGRNIVAEVEPNAEPLTAACAQAILPATIARVTPTPSSNAADATGDALDRAPCRTRSFTVPTTTASHHALRRDAGAGICRRQQLQCRTDCAEHAGVNAMKASTIPQRS